MNGVRALVCLCVSFLAAAETSVERKGCAFWGRELSHGGGVGTDFLKQMLECPISPVAGDGPPCSSGAPGSCSVPGLHTSALCTTLSGQESRWPSGFGMCFLGPLGARRPLERVAVFRLSD